MSYHHKPAMSLDDAFFLFQQMCEAGAKRPSIVVTIGAVRQQPFSFGSLPFNDVCGLGHTIEATRYPQLSTGMTVITGKNFVITNFNEPSAVVEFGKAIGCEGPYDNQTYSVQVAGQDRYWFQAAEKFAAEAKIVMHAQPNMPTLAENAHEADNLVRTISFTNLKDMAAFVTAANSGQFSYNSIGYRSDAYGQGLHNKRA